MFSIFQSSEFVHKIKNPNIFYEKLNIIIKLFLKIFLLILYVPFLIIITKSRKIFQWNLKAIPWAFFLGK